VVAPEAARGGASGLVFRRLCIRKINPLVPKATFLTHPDPVIWSARLEGAGTRSNWCFLDAGVSQDERPDKGGKRDRSGPPSLFRMRLLSPRGSASRRPLAQDRRVSFFQLPNHDPDAKHAATGSAIGARACGSHPSWGGGRAGRSRARLYAPIGAWTLTVGVMC